MKSSINCFVNLFAQFKVFLQYSSGNIPINKKSNNGPPCKSKSTEKKQVKSSKPVSASLTNNSSNKLGVTPKRGRGRPPRSSVNALTPNEIVTPSPGRGRKPYMTKKVKEAIEQEKERKAEERNKILMDWSDDDEEHGERSSRRVESDNGSDGSDAEAEQVEKNILPPNIAIQILFFFSTGLLW